MAASEHMIEHVTAPTDEARTLVDELEATLAAEYPAEQRHGFAIEALFRPGVHFFLARDTRSAIGCCGVAFDDGFAELKRMYVRDAARANGVADALLAHVEAVTIACEIARLRLETGERQFAALRFYDRAGFIRTRAFGAYATMAPDAIATSIFMEKRLRRATSDRCATRARS